MKIIKNVNNWVLLIMAFLLTSYCKYLWKKCFQIEIIFKQLLEKCIYNFSLIHNKKIC